MFKNLKHLRLALIALGTLAGCSMPQRVGPSSAEFSITAPRASEQKRGKEQNPDEDVDPAQASREVYADLIRGLLRQNQYYAALAHVQEQQQRGGNSDELQYLEAEARRSLGQAKAAEALYKGLLRGDHAGLAYHGLGLLHASRDLGRSVQLLQEAVRRRPTDVTVRNDLGYALMMSGRYREALPELATAVELDPAGEKARNNLIVLLLLSGDETGAARVAAQAGVGKETVARLRQQAQSLARSRGGASARQSR